ncbi:hypothetical protein CKA32_004944 [Geitlerinema sp. FC II]|nr:hypothetical protein CKA32_004944 [Geitlerinema sp. FC II]
MKGWEAIIFAPASRHPTGFWRLGGDMEVFHGSVGGGA